MMFPIRTGRLLLPALVALTVAVSVPTPAPAQQITVTRVQDLAFGAVLAGTTATVLPSSADAGRFHVRSSPNRTLVLSFALPTQLLSGGGLTVPVTFTATSAAWSTTDDISTATLFNPALPLQINLTQGRRDVYIWVGGQVQPPTIQPAGGYQGPLALSVTVL
jgi:hypothetical protein